MGLFFAFFACQSNHSNDAEMLEEVPVNGKVSDIIRNPATASGPLDSLHVAKISFEEEHYNFGEVLEGETVTHSYQFTNTGLIPLVISNARSTCGCTVPDWPKAPVQPGEKGEITVRFDTKNKVDRQEKPITITANTYPSQTKVYLEGFVRSSTSENP